jgi:drug/metabolite transporter (DMT)-like permease
MDGGLSAFIPGVTIGLTLALGVYRARDDEPWMVALGMAAGLLVAGVMILLLGQAGSDLDRLWILLWVVGSVALAAAVATVAGRIRRRREPMLPDDSPEAA